MPEIKIHNGLVVLDVVMREKSKRSARMILDTGASHTAISKDLAKFLGISPYKFVKRRVSTANGEIFLSVASIGSLSFLGKEVKNLKVIIHELPIGNVDGLLGLNFLQNFNVHLNFRQKELEII